MMRPRAFTPPRPSTVGRRTSRTRTEAAVELVRLEFERARLTRDLEQLKTRARVSQVALSRSSCRASEILAALVEDDSR